MRMERLVEEELVHLGADTKELGFRVGIHSGPVTAGVLRGMYKGLDPPFLDRF
jgi:class 3 adenylate cyclase